MYIIDCLKICSFQKQIVFMSSSLPDQSPQLLLQDVFQPATSRHDKVANDTMDVSKWIAVVDSILNDDKHEPLSTNATDAPAFSAVKESVSVHSPLSKQPVSTRRNKKISSSKHGHSTLADTKNRFSSSSSSSVLVSKSKPKSKPQPVGQDNTVSNAKHSTTFSSANKEYNAAANTTAAQYEIVIHNMRQFCNTIQACIDKGWIKIPPTKPCNEINKPPKQNNLSHSIDSSHCDPMCRARCMIHHANNGKTVAPCQKRPRRVYFVDVK